MLSLISHNRILNLSNEYHTVLKMNHSWVVILFAYLLKYNECDELLA